MKSCLDIKCARTTPVTARGIEATHCPTQANQGFPISASEPSHDSPVSRDRGRALKWASVQKQQQANQTPILSHLPFFIMFIAISSVCRHMVYKMEKLIRPQICFNLSKEGEKSCPLVWVCVGESIMSIL